MIFLLGVFVGALLVCLPLVAIVFTARSTDDELAILAMADTRIKSIKRETISQMVEYANTARFRELPYPGASDEIVEP